MFDEVRAQHAIDFIQHLTFSAGRWMGKPFILQDWQKNFISKLFGTVNEEGLRQYRQAIVFVPRKNGKTELGAAIALYMLCADGEKGAQVYSVASTRDQASNVFKAASVMVRNNTALSKLIKVNRSSKQMLYSPLECVYKVLSSDAGAQHGLNSSCCIFDETHEQKNRELWDVMATSMGAREQPLLISISTVGSDTSSFAYELYDYAKKVQDGIVEDETVLPLIYGIEEADDWTSLEAWKKANPSFGVTLTESFFRSECKRAMEVVSKQNSFRQLYLNQWQNQSQRWLNLLDYEQCEKNKVPAEEDLKKSSLYIGGDLSKKIDLTSISFYWPQYQYIRNVSFIPADNIKEKEKQDKANYTSWIQQNHVIATTGNVVDYSYIRKIINEYARDYNLKMIGFDPWNALDLMIKLEQEDGLPVIEIRQGYRTLSPACKELEALLVSHELTVDKNPCLKWSVNNIAIECDANENIRPTKGKGQFRRIDPIMSAIIAIAIMQQSGYTEEKVSKYETHPITFF